MANNSPALTGNSQPQHQAAAAAAQQQQQCGSGGTTKPAVSGKQGNVLPLWGNEKTMNLNPNKLYILEINSFQSLHL